MLGLFLFVINIYHSDARRVYSVDAAQGSNVTLKCPTKCNSCEWYSFDLISKKVMSDDFKYENTNSSEITIRNVDISDSISYFCERPYYSVVYLNVIVYASKGSTVIWNCPVSYTNHQWKKYTNSSWVTLSDDNKYSNTNTSQITIRKVDYTDNGQYQCVDCINVKLIWCVGKIKLNVTEYPYADIVLDHYVTTKGNKVNVTIECIVTNGDNLLWYKDDMILQRNSKYNPGNIDESYLVISDVETADRGVYKCYVENTYGSYSDETVLKIVYTEVPVFLYEGTVNESVTLSCGIYDATEVKWRHNDVQIPTGNDKYCNGNTTVPSLTITNLTREDSGRYQCESAYDSIRSIGYEIILQIKEHKNEKLTSTITVLATVGSAAVLIILISTTIVVAFIKRKRRTFRTNHDYAERDNTEVELHLYDETQATSDSKPSAHCYAYSYASSTLKSNQNESDMTSKTYNVRDLMHLLQDESLTKRIQMEFQLLNATPELTAALDYENVDVKSGAAIGKTCTNKSLIKKQDGDSGYIITTVPNQSDIDTFWTMIIDCHARYIVLLVQIKEKIFRFFPSTDVTINTSKFKVELSSSEKYPNKVFAFNLAVLNKEKKTEVQVKLCKTTEWRVGEKHPSIDTLYTLLDVVSNQESVIAVFIGSKGIGFPVCGGLGACHEVFRAVKTEKDFSILQIVVDLKKKLPDLFQTFEEYNLCYKVIGHFLENEHAYDVID